MKLRQQQTSLTSGMLDPFMGARTDVKHYYSGASEVLNMELFPQGGGRDRPGFEHVLTLTDVAGGGAEGVAMFELRFNRDQTYLILLTDLKLRVVHGGAEVWSTATPWARAQLDRVSVTRGADTMLFFHETTRPKRLLRKGSHTVWEFADMPLSNIPTKVFESGGTAEALWSDTRGWPSCGTFYAGRLYLGGSTQAPDTIACSKASSYYDFKTGTMADEGVVFNTNSDEINRITAMYSGSNLLVFTEGGEFAVGEDGPVTPDNVSALPQTKHGAAPLAPTMVEDGILYVTSRRDAERQALMETVWNDAGQQYQAQDLSLLSSSVIRGPTSLSLRRGNDKTRAYHLFLTNGDDGSMAVLNTLRSQDVTGWSLWTTDGWFLKACVIGATLYAVVRREIGGITRYFLERLVVGARTDAHKTVTLATAATAVPGFAHLAGATVRVYADGHREGLREVAGDGTITLDYPATTVEAGLPYEWAVTPMPLAIDLQDGTSIDRIKRVVSVAVDVIDAVDITIGGKPVALRRLGDGLLDQPPAPYTGVVRARLLGFDRTGAVRIAGEGPCTILGIVREVSIG